MRKVASRGKGGRFRRTHCVPMPEVGSIEDLNALLAAADARDVGRRIASRPMTVGHDWALERDLRRPLPAEPSSAAPSAAARCWYWITTWKSWPASPRRCPARPR
jgi:hypothetical protein